MEVERVRRWIEKMQKTETLLPVITHEGHRSSLQSLWKPSGSPLWNPACDFNNDGKIDMKDLAFVCRCYGQRID
jgi:hypothetical protein